MHFGEHVTIDGYGGLHDLLDDKDLVLRSLNELCEKLGMRQLAPPVIYFAKGNNFKDPGGWSAFVVIEESHIAIHTFPARGFLSADVYTCKNGMDTDLISNYFMETFDLKDIEKNFIIRGKKYPQVNI